jgi:hypothetical protein
MIRTVVTAFNNILSLPIPDKYIGKRIEVIAFAIDEPSEDIISCTKSKKTFEAIKIKTKGFKFNREQANER